MSAKGANRQKLLSPPAQPGLARDSQKHQQLYAAAAEQNDASAGGRQTAPEILLCYKSSPQRSCKQKAARPLSPVRFWRRLEHDKRSSRSRAATIDEQDLLLSGEESTSKSSESRCMSSLKAAKEYPNAPKEPGQPWAEQGGPQHGRFRTGRPGCPAEFKMQRQKHVHISRLYVCMARKLPPHARKAGNAANREFTNVQATVCGSTLTSHLASIKVRNENSGGFPELLLGLSAVPANRRRCSFGAMPPFPAMCSFVSCRSLAGSTTTLCRKTPLTVS